MPMNWPAREGLLLLGGILFAFLVWVPMVINVLPKLAGRETGEWEWGWAHLPGFFGAQGADHAVMSWLVALAPYFLVQAGRMANWLLRAFRARRARQGARQSPPGRPDQLRS